MRGKRPLDHGHPIGEVVDGSVDLVEEIEKLEDRDVIDLDTTLSQ